MWKRMTIATLALCLLLAAACGPQEQQVTCEEIGHDGRKIVAETLCRYLRNAEDEKAGLWNNRIYPRLIKLWPKDKGIPDPDTSLQLALLATETGKAFPNAVKCIAKLVLPAKFFSYFISSFHFSCYF